MNDEQKTSFDLKGNEKCFQLIRLELATAISVFYLCVCVKDLQ